MILIIVLGIVVFINWFLYQTIVIIPLNIFTYLASFGWVALLVLILIFIGWCFAD